ALMMGMLITILRVRRVCVETSRGSTEEAAGKMSTSSKVSPSRANFSSIAPGSFTKDMIAISSLIRKTPSTRNNVSRASHHDKIIIAYNTKGRLRNEYHKVV